MKTNDSIQQLAQASFLPPPVEHSGEPTSPPVAWQVCSPALLQSGVDCATAPRWFAGPIGQHWHPPVGLVPLNAYQVGDYDVVAAYDREGAIAVLREQTGDLSDDHTVEDVVLVSDKMLDNMEAFDQDENKIVPLEKSLRQEVALLTKPTYLYGWE